MSFVVVGVDEVFIILFFELWVIFFVVCVIGFFQGFVEVDGVFIEEVGGCKIVVVVELLCLICVIGEGGFEVMVVEVDSWSYGVLWMQNYVQFSCEEVD